MGDAVEPSAPNSQDLSLRLGKRALDRGFITAEQLQVALVQQARHPETSAKLADILLEKGFLTSTQLEVLVEAEKTASRSFGRIPAEPPLESLGKFKLLREVGRGGMGVVYEAHDRDLDRRVALKLLLLSPNADAKEAALDEERFVREARLSARLKHRHIVAVYEAGVVHGRRYIAQEFVNGTPLSEWRRKGSVTIRQLVSLLRDIALALHEAHEEGIIHRDLKPANVLIDRKNEPHITDFGLAKFVGQNVMQSFTAEGRVVGTPTYMSPEQVRGSNAIDRRTDIYSLGVMLYEILTGRLPFEGATAMEVMMKAVNTPVKEPSKITGLQMNPLVFSALEGVCLKAMAKQPADRYENGRQMADDLTGWLDGTLVRVRSPRTRRRVMAAVAATLLLAAAGLGISAFARRAPSPGMTDALAASKPVRTSLVFDASRPTEDSGLRLRTSGRHECRIEFIDGKAVARPVKSDGSSGFLFLDIDDAWAQETVMAEILIEYFDTAPAWSNFAVEYDSMDGRWPYDGTYKRSGLVILQGTRTWKTARLLMTSPRLENRMELGADLRLGPDHAELLVSRIEVRRWAPNPSFAGPAPTEPSSRQEPGLLAEFHDGIHLSDLKKTSVDQNLLFDWQGPAWRGGPADEFSIRWTGALSPAKKGRYLVEVQSDDGVRLFLGGREVISNWTNHPPRTDAAICVMEPGSYPLRVEYFEGGGGAYLRVAWFEERAGRMWPIDPPPYHHPVK
jgi:predicted Ser/Thr protein kinase